MYDKMDDFDADIVNYPFVDDVDISQHIRFEPRHVKTNSERAPSEDSDQPGHPPSLIRVFAVRSIGS